MTEKSVSRKPKKLRPHTVARRPLRGLVNLLRRPEKDEWPDHLLRAYNVLADELTARHGKTSDTEVRELLIECVSAAHQCLRSQDLQLLNIGRAQIQRRLQKGFEAIAACLKRPDRLHKKLDYDINNRLRTDQVVDLETLEFIFTATVAILGKIPARRKSRQLRAAIEERHFRDFAGLDPVAIAHCQKAVTLLASKVSAGEAVSAAKLFAILAKELRRAPASSTSVASNSSIVQFAKAVVRIWRKRNLTTSRAPNYLNPDYQTRFHEFSNLIYAAVVVPPATPRQDLPVDEVEASPVNRKEATEQPERTTASSAVPRTLIWIIGDHHVRKALASLKNDGATE